VAADSGGGQRGQDAGGVGYLGGGGGFERTRLEPRQSFDIC
jgi:hypothetical protein